MYSTYIDGQDRKVLTLLIARVLLDGHLLSVSDGEETVLDNCGDFEEITSALNGTGEDWINIIDSDSREVITAFYCLYGEADKSDPLELFADYYCGEYPEAIIAYIEKGLTHPIAGC